VRLALAMLLASSIAAAAPEPDVRRRAGRRCPCACRVEAGRGLRETTDFLVKELDRRGIAVRRIGPYRVRGAELTRFISETPSTPWLAIHVLRRDGKTLILFVPRASP
jgi:hypothetical protein